MICSKSILAVMEGNHKCQGDAVVNTDIEAGNVQDDIDEDSNATAAHSNHSHGYAAAPAAKTTGAEEETTLDYQSAITAKIMANDTPSFNPVPLPMLNRDIVTDMLTSLNRTTPETVDEKHDLVVFKFMNFRTNIAKYHRNGGRKRDITRTICYGVDLHIMTLRVLRAAQKDRACELEATQTM